MEKFLFEKRILKIICLLVMVGILCVTPKLEVQAAAVDDSGIVGETGQCPDPGRVIAIEYCK